MQGIELRDPLGGISQLRGSRGAAFVQDITRPVGDEFAFMLCAPLRTGGNNPTFTGFALKNVTGFKLFELQATKLTADDFLVVAWSTEVDDETALASLLDSVCDEIETAVSAPLKAGVQRTNVDIALLAGRSMTHVYDGIHTIKTVLPVVVKYANTTVSAAAPVLCLCRVIQ